MSVEAIRGCGFRKVGGLYLCGGGFAMGCDRLPYELDVCPVCGAGVKFSRGWTWVDWMRYAGIHQGEETEHLISAKVQCTCPQQDTLNPCPVCYPPRYEQPYGLLWVGEQFYSPQSFIQEALDMGVSRWIAAVPKNLKLGETWVLFAHKHAAERPNIVDTGKEWELSEATKESAVFYAFRPQRLELLIWKSEFTHDKAVELEEKHITPIVIPDGDIDHDPRTSLKPKPEEKTKLFFDGLRRAIKEGE